MSNIPACKIQFVMNALGLKSREVAEAAGISTAHLSNIISERDVPSLAVSNRISNSIEAAWFARNGRTNPPEVAGIVYEIIWPPRPPFNPHDGESKRGPGRPRKDNANANPGSSSAQGQVRISATARVATPSAGYANSPSETRLQNENLRLTSQQRQGSEIRKSGSGQQTTPVIACTALSPQGGFLQPEQNPPPSANIIDATEAFRRAITFDSRESAAPAPVVQAATEAKLWTRQTLLDIRAAARIRGLLTDDMPNVLAMRAQFYSDLHTESPAWLEGLSLREQYTAEEFKKWRDAVNKRLVRALPVKLRDRKSDSDLAYRKQVVAAYTLQFAASIESVPHSKGAYLERAWMDLRATLQACWDVPEFRARVCEQMGRDVSYGTLERIFHTEFGKVSPAERAMKRFFSETKATEPDYAGSDLEMDATGIPVEVLDAWGRARNSGDVAQIAAFLTDRASLRTWIHTEATTSEVYLWSPLLLKFFESENYAPESLVMDEGGRGFNALRNASKWLTDGIDMEAGQRLALACGVRPYVHAPHHAQGKGSVESGGVKSGKSALKRVLARRFAAALFKELKHAPINYRTVQSQSEWMEILTEWESSLNARIIQRVGDGSFTRDGVWQLDKYAARRSERALVSDWRDRYRDIIKRGFVMELRSENGLFRDKARAELRSPLLTPVPKGSLAILFPGGLRAGDEQYGDDLLRGVIVEQRQGQPRYHAIEALKVQKTFLGFEADRGRVGEFMALPETDDQRRARAWVDAGKIMPAAVQQAHDAARREKREGTSGTYI